MVYIRIKADISALTYPNKRQAVCYPTSTGGGAGGGGDRGGRKSKKRETGGKNVRLKETETRGECFFTALIFPSLPQPQRRKKNS